MQLKHTDRVFRLYVKPSEDKAFYLIEESLSPIVLPQVLDSIRNPVQANRIHILLYVVGLQSKCGSVV